MNLMTHDGDQARIDDDEDLDLFRGEILGLNGGADFDGKNPQELRIEFKLSLEIFLTVCQEKSVVRHVQSVQVSKRSCKAPR